MAKIVYWHHKDPKNEAEDARHNWWTCPPTLEDLTEKQEQLLTRIWERNHSYIVDPLGHKQCLYIMLMEIPFGKLISKFIKKEHRYEEL